jgi:antitoxin FitA
LQAAGRADIVSAIKKGRGVGQVIIRNLDDEVIEQHRWRAKARGVSLEQELREVLATAAKPTREELLAEMDRIRAMTPEPPPGERWYSAEERVREGRDAR